MINVHCVYGVFPVMADTIETTNHQYLLNFKGDLVAAFPLHTVTDIVENGISILKDAK